MLGIFRKYSDVEFWFILIKITSKTPGRKKGNICYILSIYNAKNINIFTIYNLAYHL